MNKGTGCFPLCPLFHVGAQLLIALPAMTADISFALMEKFSASRYWDQVRHYNCNVLHYLGSIAQILLAQPERPDDADNPGERMIGGGVPKKIWKKFEDRFGVKIIEAYGLTECGGVSVHNRIGSVKEGSIGLPVPHQRVEVVDENDKIAAPFTKGEIVIPAREAFHHHARILQKSKGHRGGLREPLVSHRRLRLQGRRRLPVFPGAGRLFHKAQGGERLARGGGGSHINTHPQVEESCVVGVPSEMGDEDVKAYVVPKKSAAVAPEEIIKWCEDQISYFKIPRFIEFLGRTSQDPDQPGGAAQAEKGGGRQELGQGKKRIRTKKVTMTMWAGDDRRPFLQIQPKIKWSRA